MIVPLFAASIARARLSCEILFKICWPTAAQQCCQLPCVLGVICCGSEKAQEARFASIRLACAGRLNLLVCYWTLAVASEILGVAVPPTA